MTDIQLEHEIKKETFKKLQRILSKGEVTLSREISKHDYFCYALRQGGNTSASKTICSCIDNLYETLFPAQKDEIVINGITYVKKESTND